MLSIRPWWSWFFFVHLMVMVLAAVLASTNHLPSVVSQYPGGDKIGHCLLFGGVAFFAVGLFHRYHWARVALLVFLLATLEELSQALIPHRSLDGCDVLANALGIAVFAPLAAWLRGRTVQC